MSEPSRPAAAPGSALIDRLITTLVHDYSDRFPAERVVATFHDSYASLATKATVTTYLPTLAERFTRERLDAYAQTHGMQTRRTPEILFICVQNAGRSQMAAAFARYYTKITRTSARVAPIRASASSPKLATP